MHEYPRWYSKCLSEYSERSLLVFSVPLVSRRSPKSSTLSTNDQSVSCEQSKHPNVSTLST